MMKAFEASARVTSDSLIAPTAEWTTETLTPSTSILRSEAARASTEPCTSDLMITLTVLPVLTIQLIIL